MRVASTPLVLLGLALPATAVARPDLRGEKIVADFARCAVRGAPDEARALLEAAPGTATEGKALDAFTRKRLGCMNFGPAMGPMQLKLNARAIRGAVAERLYLDLDGTHSPAAFRSGPDDEAASEPVEYSVVRCAVSRNSEAADRLVRASRLSKEEAAATRALAPALTACARGRGRLDISGTAIHGWAAEALYKQSRGEAAGSPAMEAAE
ncbi:MAG: hypothetical protein QOJ91_141 [Sphingomonadales bacterium]|jgi:hypothetical protein|nr:hypothetical protein [Sphingomonadales bacterium]